MNVERDIRWAGQGWPAAALPRAPQLAGVPRSVHGRAHAGRHSRPAAAPASLPASLPRFELLARLCPNSTGADIRRCGGRYRGAAGRAFLRFAGPKLCARRPCCCVTPRVPALRALCCSVATEAGMYAIRARRKTVTEKDFLDAVNKVGPHSLGAG